MSLLAGPPHVPVEVAENIIDQLSGVVQSLRSCSLTCQDLSTLSDYFKSNVRMASAVRSLSILPAVDKTKYHFLSEAIPVFLLSRLPNLRSYKVHNSCNRLKKIPISFHSTTLAGVRTLLLEELSLAHIVFRTSAELARLLISMSCLRHLECKDVLIEDRGNHSVATTADVARRFPMLSGLRIRGKLDISAVNLIIGLSLSTLSVLWFGDNKRAGDYSALNLSQLTHLHSLTIPIRPNSDVYRALDLSLLPHLHSLTLTVQASLESFTVGFDQIIQILTTTPRELRQLIIVFKMFFDVYYPGPGNTARAWHSDYVLRKCHLLTNTLLILGTPGLTFSLPEAKWHRLPFWSRVIHDHFPRLHDEGHLQVQCSSESCFGHDRCVTAMAASPEGRYVATGAADGTVLIWSGPESQRTSPVEVQCPTTYDSVTSLHFSQSGDFLVATQGSDVLIWRVTDCYFVRSVGGYSKLSCVWGRDTAFDYADLTSLGVSERGSVSLSFIAAPIPTSWDSVDDARVPILRQSTTIDLGDLRRSVGEDSFVIQSSSGSFVAAYCAHADGVCDLWRHMGKSPSAYGCHELTYTERWADMDNLSCATFARDELLIVGSKCGTILWWDISSFPLTTTEPSGALTLMERMSPDSNITVNSMCISPTGSFLLAICTHQSRSNDQGESVIAVLRCTYNSRMHGRLDLGFESPHIFLRGHTREVSAACISPCERYIATASGDTTVRLWSARNGELLWTFHDHDAPVTRIVFSGDGRILASADQGGQVCRHEIVRFIEQY